jgi:gp16 family phage-associated protein
MVTERVSRHNPENRALDPRRVKAGLIMLGHSLASFARAHKVSRPLVSRIISGKRPALTGKSAAIRRKLEEIAA